MGYFKGLIKVHPPLFLKFGQRLHSLLAWLLNAGSNEHIYRAGLNYVHHISRTSGPPNIWMYNSQKLHPAWLCLSVQGTVSSAHWPGISIFNPTHMGLTTFQLPFVISAQQRYKNQAWGCSDSWEGYNTKWMVPAPHCRCVHAACLTPNTSLLKHVVDFNNIHFDPSVHRVKLFLT